MIPEADSVSLSLKLEDKLAKITDDLVEAGDVDFLPDDTFAVTVRKLGVVRTYDQDRSYKDFANGVKPYGVASDRSGRLAFTNRPSRKEGLVHVYAANGDQMVKWGQDLSWKPHAVAMNNRGQLVVSDLSDKHAVGVFSMDGLASIKFGSKGGKHSHREFNHPLHLAVDTHDRIIVSDRGNNCVKLFDERSGLMIRKIDGLSHPRGVCTDIYGNIIVCDTGHRKVKVYSPDCQLVGNLLTESDGLAYPYGISWSRWRKSHKLVVSQQTASRKGRFRKIRVYQLEDALKNAVHKTVDLFAVLGKAKEIQLSE